MQAKDYANSTSSELVVLSVYEPQDFVSWDSLDGEGVRKEMIAHQEQFDREAKEEIEKLLAHYKVECNDAGVRLDSNYHCLW